MDSSVFGFDDRSGNLHRVQKASPLLGFFTRAPRARRVLFFGSVTHVWSDLFFALLVPLLPLIKNDLGLTYTETVLLKSVFSGASAVLQVPAGFLAEAVSELWLLVLGNVWVAAGLVAMGFSPGFAVLLIVALIGGLGGGSQHPIAASMVSRAYDRGGRATAVGTVNFAGDVGKIAAPLIVVAMALAHFDWRTALWLVGVAGIVFMAATALFRRGLDLGRPARDTASGSAGTVDETRVGAFVKLSFVGFLDAATRASALVFLPFVLDDKGMGTAGISAMLFLLFVGGAAGKFACGWLGDRYGLVNVTIATKGLTAVLLVLSLVTPVWAITPLVLVLGFALQGTSSVLYAAVADFVPVRRRARLYGLYYTVIDGGSVMAPLAYGVVADLVGLGEAVVLISLVAAAILPSSLTLRRHLDTPSSATGVTSGG